MSLHLTQEEFQECCEMPSVRTIFETLEIPVGRKRLAQRVFEVMDADGEGHVSIEVQNHANGGQRGDG